MPFIHVRLFEGRTPDQKRAFAEAVQMRADAGARDAHADPEHERPGHQGQADRPDVSAGRQALGPGDGQERAEHRVIAEIGRAHV